jgi:hypothetical protein
MIILLELRIIFFLLVVTVGHFLFPPNLLGQCPLICSFKFLVLVYCKRKKCRGFGPQLTLVVLVGFFFYKGVLGYENFGQDKASYSRSWSKEICTLISGWEL